MGMGIERTEDKLLGVVRTSFRETPKSSAAQSGEQNFGDAGEYERNVQIVELNALKRSTGGYPLEKTQGVLPGSRA